MLLVLSFFPAKVDNKVIVDSRRRPGALSMIQLLVIIVEQNLVEIDAVLSGLLCPLTD